jgi:peptidyl-prolyl cis-trans isomerase C
MNALSPTARLRLCAVAVLALSIAACAKKPQTAAPAPAAAADTAAVATVNGTPITRDAFDLYVKSRTGGKDASQLTAEQRGQVLDELVGMQLMAAEAAKQGLDKDPQTTAQLAIDRMQLLADAESQKYLKGKEPTDQELHAAYDTAIAAMDKTEYHARHILVADKDLALAITKRLKAGADFAALAKADSIDSSKTSGGDLGWFETSRMVKPFADAVKSLKKGEITPQPVQTQFGWHVIQLLDTRPITPPPFDQVKERVANMVMRKKLQDYVDQLKKSAKIDTKL